MLHDNYTYTLCEYYIFVLCKYYTFMLIKQISKLFKDKILVIYGTKKGLRNGKAISLLISPTFQKPTIPICEIIQGRP